MENSPQNIRGYTDIFYSICYKLSCLRDAPPWRAVLRWLKLKFHGICFFVASSWHPRRHTRHARGSSRGRRRVGRAATSPFSLPREHDTHDLLRTSSRGCHEDATRDTASVEFKHNHEIHMFDVVIDSSLAVPTRTVSRSSPVCRQVIYDYDDYGDHNNNKTIVDNRLRPRCATHSE